MLILDVLMIAGAASLGVLPLGIGIGWHLRSKKRVNQPERLIVSSYWGEEPKDW